MATRQTSRTNLVGVSSLAFIRSMPIQFTITNTKPLTRLYAFFDGVSIDQYITPSNLTTDANGSATGTFNIPSATFTTGKKTIRFQDTPVLTTDIAGSLIGSAEADFTSTAVKNTLQETVTIINIIPPPPPTAPQDPIAQTFFTYGITGGCYITAIDVYFQTKDANIPVTLQIRNVDNGYPSNTLVSRFSTKSLNPSSVSVSSDASIPTKFKFDVPVYLEENKDYCFVLMSNCNSYHVWSSKLGEKSIESNIVVYDQPFIGTLFKSENNITWTAEQTEDIKFTIYKAEFDIANSKSVVFNAKSDPLLVSGDNFSVQSGLSTVTVKFDYKHALDTGSYIGLYPLTGATYRGIAATNLSGRFQVTKVDEYTIQFTTKNSVTASSTGTLSSIGFIKSIVIDSGGSGYTVGTSLSISGNATAVVSSVSSTGAITGINITNGGSGYLTAPVVTPPNGGSGAILVAIVDALFGVETNRVINSYTPIIGNATVPDTKIQSTIKPVLSGYINQGTLYQINYNKENVIDKTCWLVSQANDIQLAGGQQNYYTKVNSVLSSNNKNTSPVIYLNDISRLSGKNYIINSQSSIGNTELAASGGLAQSKYITKPINLANTSVGARIFVSAYSMTVSGFDVYIRTSLSGNGVTHKSLGWTKMKCDVSRNKSTKKDEYLDYTFYIDSLQPFDVYDLKIVMYSDDTSIIPIIDNYRTIILAS